MEIPLETQRPIESAPRPAQEFMASKFSSEGMKDIYRYIKFLKKALHLDLSSYWVKSELNKPEYQAWLPDGYYYCPIF